jgi:hypothetical protein
MAFFNFVIFVKDGHCNYSTRALETRVTPMHGLAVWLVSSSKIVVAAAEVIAVVVAAEEAGREGGRKVYDGR